MKAMDTQFDSPKFLNVIDAAGMSDDEQIRIAGIAFMETPKM